jgi:hypothetical protein
MKEQQEKPQLAVILAKMAKGKPMMMNRQEEENDDGDDDDAEGLMLLDMFEKANDKKEKLQALKHLVKYCSKCDDMED